MPSRRDILQDIHVHADSMNQEVDQACLRKLAELSDTEIGALYEQAQEKIVNARYPVRNISAVLGSIIRAVSGDGDATRHVAVDSRLPLTLRRRGDGAPSGGEAGGRRHGGVQALLEEYGIYGVDDMAIDKLEEMSIADQNRLFQEFQAVSEAQQITSPSKWLFAKARTFMAQRGEFALVKGGGDRDGDSYEIHELPDVWVDEKCFDKLQELEPGERRRVLRLFEEERQIQDIRNPSSWLFGKARSAVVARVTGGGGRGGGGGGGARHDDGDPFAALQQMGVDDMAMSKLQELSSGDLGPLLSQFHDLHSAGQIGEPSKWLFARARTIAAAHSQAKRASYQQGDSWQGGGGGGRGHGGNGGSGAFGGRGGGYQTVAELDGAELDARAFEKLSELEPEERDALFKEFQLESQRNGIQNPSGWVFGRARTKVVDRLTGRSKSDHRSRPY